MHGAGGLSLLISPLVKSMPHDIPPQQLGNAVGRSLGEARQHLAQVRLRVAAR
jgi:hypothetical protein